MKIMKSKKMLTFHHEIDIVNWKAEHQWQKTFEWGEVYGERTDIG